MRDACASYNRLSMFWNSDEDDNAVHRLLRLGSRLGFLTYEQLNEELPDAVVSPGRLDALLARVDALGIRLIDESDAAALD